MTNDSDDQRFAEHLRRRTRLGLATGVSLASAALLSCIGGFTPSRPVVFLAGVAWLATSITVYRLQSDGYVAPSATIDFLGYTAEDRQAAAPFIFVLWALGAFAAAYAMK